MGVVAELDIGIGTLPKKLEAEHVIVSKVFALPTACLAFNQEKKSFASPTPPPPPPPPPSPPPPGSGGPGGGPGTARPREGAAGAKRALGDGEEVRIMLWGSMFVGTLAVLGVL